MNLQLRLVKDAYPSKYRTHAARRHDGDLVARLLRAGRCAAADDARLLHLDAAAGAHRLRADRGRGGAARRRGGRAHEVALQHAVAQRDLQGLRVRARALLLRRGAGRATRCCARIYRPASDLGRPNFGATLLQVAPESNNSRLAIAFADASFHLGWAEIVAGLAAGAGRRVSCASSSTPRGSFPVSDEARAAYDDLQRRIDAALARDDRGARRGSRGRQQPPLPGARLPSQQQRRRRRRSSSREIAPYAPLVLRGPQDERGGALTARRGDPRGRPVWMTMRDRVRERAGASPAPTSPRAAMLPDVRGAVRERPLRIRTGGLVKTPGRRP